MELDAIQIVTAHSTGIADAVARLGDHIGGIVRLAVVGMVEINKRALFDPVKQQRRIFDLYLVPTGVRNFDR